VARPFDADDAWHLAAGTHTRLWEVLGAHRAGDTTTFRVWAPDATAVSVLGDGNSWTPGSDRLEPDPSGVWRGTFGGYLPGDRYKYAVTGRSGEQLEKADPVAFAAELPPATASLVWAPHNDWDDGAWMQRRGGGHRHDSAISIYEVHLGSWRFEPGGYAAMGRQLAEYCIDMGARSRARRPAACAPGRRRRRPA
jgi:1,4-alpha-glucan branching enzyme